MKKILYYEMTLGKCLSLLSLALFVLSFILLLCSGCMTEEKATNYLASKGKLAGICADKYPPKITPGKPVFKSDTIFTPGPSVECPPAKIDTITGKPEKVYVHCPPTKTVHDSVYVHDIIENFARIKAQEAQISELNNKLLVSQASENKAEKKAANRLWVIIGLAVCDALIIFLRIKSII